MDGDRAAGVAGVVEIKSATVLRVGRYEVNVQIAAGGMATVHLGRTLGAAGFARVVAIKRLLPQYAADPEFESMFVNEARIAARIRHPNVAPTLDVVSSDGELLLVMEYVHGEALSRLMASAIAAHDLPQPVALAIICDALHGLHAAHEAKDPQGSRLGIVHRDVSPQNIIVGADGVARVIDFGIAKASDSISTTLEGTVRGKAAYMAPEQIYCEALTRRTDIYPLGVILWELLVGERLFPGGTRPELMRKVEGRVDRPRQRVARISPRLDEIVMRALAVSEAERFATAEEMAKELEKSFTLAKPSQIAAWVERHASEALATRAALLARVESAARSVPPPVISSAAPAVTSIVTRAVIPVARLPLRQVTPQPEVGRAKSNMLRLHPLLFVIAGLLVALVTALLIPVLRSPRPDIPSAVATPIDSTAAQTSKDPRPSHLPAEPEHSAGMVLSAPAPAVVASGTAPPLAPSVGTARHTDASLRTAKSRTKPRAVKDKGCNPPYTTDAQGRRHFKVECF